MLTALQDEKTLVEIADQYQVHPTQVTQWKKQLLKRAVDVFNGSAAHQQTHTSVTSTGNRIPLVSSISAWFFKRGSLAQCCDLLAQHDNTLETNLLNSVGISFAGAY